MWHEDWCPQATDRQGECAACSPGPRLSPPEVGLRSEGALGGSAARMGGAVQGRLPSSLLWFSLPAGSVGTRTACLCTIQMAHFSCSVRNISHLEMFVSLRNLQLHLSATRLPTLPAASISTCVCHTDMGSPPVPHWPRESPQTPSPPSPPTHVPQPHLQ